MKGTASRELERHCKRAVGFSLSWGSFHLVQNILLFFPSFFKGPDFTHTFPVFPRGRAKREDGFPGFLSRLPAAREALQALLREEESWLGRAWKRKGAKGSRFQPKGCGSTKIG